MQLTIDIKSLQAGIAVVIKSLSSKPALPVLEGMYLSATKEGLLLRCSDLSLQIDCIVEADVMEEGAVVLPGRLFSEIIRKLNEETLDIRQDDRTLFLKAGRSKMNLQCTDANEFPDMFLSGEKHAVSLPQIQFKEMIRQTVFATAQEESKPILTGVLCEVKGHAFNMVALDGFRLALRHTNIQAELQEMEVVVPAKSMLEISRTLSDAEDPLNIEFSSNHLSIDLGHTKIISRLLDGDFIKYQSILPTQHTSRVRVNRHSLMDSIDRAMLMAREGTNNLIRFSISEGILQILANSAMGRVEEDVEIDLNGENLEIAFNAKYFSDVLKSLTDEEIFLDLNNNVSPCVVRPIQGDAYYYLILPVRIFS